MISWTTPTIDLPHDLRIQFFNRCRTMMRTLMDAMVRVKVVLHRMGRQGVLATVAFDVAHDRLHVVVHYLSPIFLRHFAFYFFNTTSFSLIFLDDVVVSKIDLNVAKTLQ
jgi:hypothetical protein